MSCQVTVTQGTLQGKECVTFYGKKYYSFEGIPYAKPPVGKLRFRNPEEPDIWQGIRDATKPGNKCAQINPYSSTPLEGAEDCLYLNVYTPYLPKEKTDKLPVIFFVHGGRLIFGYGDYYSPDYLLKHDVILVTINYRLNILGFLCLNIPEAPGNIGIKDATKALKWVHKNISVFNGDCQNVTVFGESAGAAIVESFLVSKMSRGLVSKVIAQSGTCFSDMYVMDDDPVEKAKRTASILGKDLTDKRDLYDFLVDLPIEDLIFAFSVAELSRPPSVINAYYSPVVEKEFDGIERFFTEDPKVTVRENRFENVPIIAGVSSHEGALFLRKNDAGEIMFEEEYKYFVPRFMNLNNNGLKTYERKLRGFYLQGRKAKDCKLENYVNLVSDVFFNRDIVYFTEMMAKKTDKLYFYEFFYPGNMNTRVMKRLNIDGATHGDIVQYQFYRKSKADKCSVEDNKMVEFLNETWCNFAKTGKPTWPNQQLKWLPYTAKDRHCLIIDKELKLVKDPDRERRVFWTNILEEKCKL